MKKLIKENNRLELTSVAYGNNGGIEKLKLENDSVRNQLTKLVNKKDNKRAFITNAEREELEQLWNKSEQHCNEKLNTS